MIKGGSTCERGTHDGAQAFLGLGGASDWRRPWHRSGLRRRLAEEGARVAVTDLDLSAAARAAPAALRPAGQADPGRGGARGWLVRRRRRGRRGARGVGRDARSTRRGTALFAGPRLGRAVLPRRRPGARRGSRGAGHAAAVAARRRPVPRPARGCSSSRRRRDLDARRVPRLGRRRARRRRRRPARVDASRRGAAERAPRSRDLLTRASVLAAANDLAPAAIGRGAGARAVQAGAPAPARAPGRRFRLRPDPLGALSFPCRRRPLPPRRSAPPSATGDAAQPGRQAPFVAATRILATTIDTKREP